MVAKLFLTLIAAVLISNYNYAQADGNNSASHSLINDKQDLTKTVNPRPDLAGKADTEKREKKLISLNEVTLTNNANSTYDEIEEQLIEKSYQSFNQVVNPITSEPKKED